MSERRQPPFSPASSFMAEQEQRASHWAEVEDSGQAATYDRRGRPQLQTLDPSAWEGKDVPGRDWLIEGWLLRGTVALLTGDGGMGKSLLMQMLCTAAAVAKPWLGIPVKQLRSYALFCEDDETELHIRQDRINRHYGCSYLDVGGYFHMAARPGADSILEIFDRNTDKAQKTPLWKELREAVLGMKAGLLVIDTAADVFGGQENFRRQVRTFVSSLRGLAREMNGSVILTAHPSVTGMQTGSGISGSTAWHNSVRSRAYLTKPVAIGEEDMQTTARLLKFPKNNSGPASGTLVLDWNDGVFAVSGLAMNGAPPPLSTVERLELSAPMLDALRAWVQAGDRVQSSLSYPLGFVNRLRRDNKALARIPHGELAGMQERLIRQGRIVRVEMGRKHKRRHYLRCPEQRYLDEDFDPLAVVRA